METIKVTGIETLTDFEKSKANKLAKEYYEKIQRQLKNLTSLKITIKAYNKNNSKKKFSINVEILAPTKKFEANASDWDLARTIHKVMNKIKNEIEHSLHISDQHEKNTKLVKKLKKI